MNLIRKLLGLANTSNGEVVTDAQMRNAKQAGMVNGRHYSQSAERIKKYKREGKYQEAIALLRKAVDATEAEARCEGRRWDVALWYYEQLAIIYRKEKQYQQEVDILVRYVSLQKPAHAHIGKIADRLVKARQLLEKHMA